MYIYYEYIPCTPCQYIKKTSFKKTRVSGPEFLREIRDSRRSLRLFYIYIHQYYIYIHIYIHTLFSFFIKAQNTYIYIYTYIEFPCIPCIEYSNIVFLIVARSAGEIFLFRWRGAPEKKIRVPESLRIPYNFHLKTNEKCAQPAKARDEGLRNSRPEEIFTNLRILQI